MLVISTIYAQDYQIGFTGTGASTTVDSVKVENLTQCTSINLSASDILHLVASVGINESNAVTGNKMSIYPNPMTDFCLFDFEATIKSKATIGLYDIVGKRISQVQELLTKGHHTYQLSGISNGIYTLRVESEAYSYNSKLISINATLENIELKHIVTIPDIVLTERRNGLKSEKLLIDMQYIAGDILKLTGKSGAFSTVVMLVPTNSQTVTFTFIACTDSDGNNYSIVKIGEQWWMAENLNSETFATITSPQASGTKFCMDINGQEDTTCPMGGLYEWDNLMQGASFCNGTGAYPNDRCDTTVQGLCPNGWHIPSHFEWNTLSANSGDNPSDFPYNMSLGVYGVVEGGNLKAKCTTYWWDPNEGATNKTGFSAIPGGDTWDNVYEDFGQSSYFWTSTATDYSVYYTPWVYALNYSVSTIGRSEYVKENGFSARCVKD
jgi:uncharacterized protein (TIGR02145 family)